MMFFSSETLLMIQNMTFKRARGFSTKPSDPLDVPYHNEESDSTLAAAGVLESNIRKESSDEFPWTSRAIVSLKRGAKKRNIRYQSFTHLWEIEQLNVTLGNKTQYQRSSGFRRKTLNQSKVRRINRVGRRTF
jgi:hypothetical protein